MRRDLWLGLSLDSGDVFWLLEMVDDGGGLLSQTFSLVARGHGVWRIYGNRKIRKVVGRRQAEHQSHPYEHERDSLNPNSPMLSSRGVQENRNADR